MLWWLSVHGICRDHDLVADAALRLVPDGAAVDAAAADAGDGERLHPKCKLPARCFAYVGSAADPHSWHLPYLRVDGTVDVRRLPKAVQAILSNYRGERGGGIPEAAIPDVLVRLARAARLLGKFPDRTAEVAPAYVQLAGALEQLGRLDDAFRPDADRSVI